MSEPPRAGRLISVDWGERRIGIALSDEQQILASPHTTLTRRRGKRFPLQTLLTLIHEHHAVGVVLGLPLESDGSEGNAAREVRLLGNQITSRSGVFVDFQDERFTTARVLRSVREMGGTTRDRKHDVDAMAAALVLQQYMDARR